MPIVCALFCFSFWCSADTQMIVSSLGYIDVTLKHMGKLAFSKWQYIILVTLVKFDWGLWYVIIFLYVQFWIRLTAVSKRGKKVRIVAFPAVRSVNKSRDTRNCVQNKPEYAICVIFTTRSYYKAVGLILCYCPACRTYLIATRFWVVVICPIIKCLTVLEFSFILFDLCLFITIFNFILNYVPIVTFWIFTYHEIWILLIIFCFIWNYWIVYFLTCLEVFWSVVS